MKWMNCFPRFERTDERANERINRQKLSRIAITAAAAAPGEGNNKNSISSPGRLQRRSG